jgi:hypothetical protein
MYSHPRFCARVTQQPRPNKKLELCFIPEKNPIFHTPCEQYQARGSVWRRQEKLHHPIKSIPEAVIPVV